MQRAKSRPVAVWTNAFACPSLTNQTFSAGSPSKKIDSPLAYFRSTIFRSISGNIPRGTCLKTSSAAIKALEVMGDLPRVEDLIGCMEAPYRTLHRWKGFAHPQLKLRSTLRI